VNKLQLFVTRLLGLEKPIDKRWLWAGASAIALVAFLLFTSMNDGSTSASVDANGAKITASAGTGASAGSGAGSNTPITAAAPKIYVHVVGYVVHPGLYALQVGDRVSDAIFAADGFGKHADQASINLARPLTDGEQIVVLGGSSKSLNSSTFSAPKSSAQSLVNLNHAPQSEIESLPGVGPTLASRIIDWRLANGGFKTKADLQKVAGIGDKLFGRLKDLVSL
jgi:competence protein ComEA